MLLNKLQGLVTLSFVLAYKSLHSIASAIYTYAITVNWPSGSGFCFLAAQLCVSIGLFQLGKILQDDEAPSCFHITFKLHCTECAFILGKKKIALQIFMF